MRVISHAPLVVDGTEMLASNEHATKYSAEPSDSKGQSLARLQQFLDKFLQVHRSEEGFKDIVIISADGKVLLAAKDSVKPGSDLSRESKQDSEIFKSEAHNALYEDKKI